MTKEEITAAILSCVEKLGKAPTHAELLRHGGVSRREVRKHFGTYKRALDEYGLEARGVGKKVGLERLFLDWAGVVRRLKKLPTILEYEELGKYCTQPFRRRFGGWTQVPDAMKQHAEEHGHTEEWKDVLELVARRGDEGHKLPVPGSVPKVMEDRPMYGMLLQGCPLVFAPTNEAGVLYLFGAVSAQLGFLVLRIQTQFPDCEAMRVVGENRLQWVRIECEYESRNFQKHMHDPAGCDLIVCWEHNWPECPLEVVELKKVISTQQSAVSQNQRQDLNADKHE